MILVSACLMGITAKFDGTCNRCDLLMEYVRSGRFIPVCPEQLGGLPTPREAAEIAGGTGADVLAGSRRVVTRSGMDVTEKFLQGARELLSIAQMLPVRAAILKERSPSCGGSVIYDGSFTHAAVSGEGVAAALLRQHKVPVYSEEAISKKLLDKLIE